jgi:PAS domain S-box-containing protein
VTLAVRALAKRLNWLDAERRQAAEKVARLAALVNASSEAIMSSDERGVITTCNPAAERLYGYSEREIVGQPASVLCPPERRLEQRRLMQAARRGDAMTECDTRRQRKDGALIEVSVMLSRIVEAGSFRGYCAVTRDITGRVRSLDHLEEIVRDRTHELFRSRAETLKSLALAAEYRDYDTAEHTERVGERSAQLAACLGLPAGYVELIGRAAPLHDVGKIGIPDHILLKPSALTEEEFGTMKGHTILGSRLLARSDNEVLQLGESIALTHHERWDGNGYPARLAGEGIPLTGRIVGVVDAFDAMTRDRPYRAARSVDHALAEIARYRGTQFDPQVAATFLELQRGQGLSGHVDT